MRFSFLFACLTAAATVGCHHEGRRCSCQQGCYQAGNPGGCVSGGCAPQAAGPGRVRLGGDGPAPTVPTPPVRTAEKPRNVMKEVKHSPGQSNFGRAKDFSWLMGQLRRVHVNGGNWKIRYAPIDVQDRWGGSVILADDARIDRFKDGDFVYVEGEMLATRPTVYLAGPLYRVSTIRPLTVADRQKAWANRLQGTTIRK
jgi:hypothetical protein